MTRLLNTPIIGPRVAIVDSSWIDMLAGLSPEGILKMPPGFWAKAEAPAHTAARSPPAAANVRRFAFICLHPSLRARLAAGAGCIFAAAGLPVEPDVLHPIAVVDAVDHGHEPLDVGLPAGRAARVEDDRPSPGLGQPLFDLPHQRFAFYRVGFARLPVDQFVDLRV